MGNLLLLDFHKLFLGDSPPSFLLEIIIRTAIMYGYTIMLLRFLGKRGMGQISTLEVAIIVCFGSAVGDPMIEADMPLLYGIVSVTTISFLQIGMESVINRHKKLEEIMEGKAECIVDDGIIDLEILKRNNLSHEDLFRSLRNSEVEHLGQVKRVLYETSGQISVFFHSPKQVKPGLSVMPSELIPEQEILTDLNIADNEGLYACTNCGNTKFYKTGKNFGKCRNCDCANWMKANVD